MTIQQCKYVLRIVKTGSFSEAAKQMFIAQSSLSISIKSLEQELGIKIFERSGNGVCLTEEGSEFVRYATQVVETDAFVTKRYHEPSVQKRLFVATQHYDFVADIFGNLIKEISDDSYKFSIQEINTHDVIHGVQTGYSDIGIIAIKDGDYEVMKRYLNNKDIVFQPILEVAPHVFVRKEHPMAKNAQLNITQMKDYPYVSYEQGEHTSSFFTEELMDVTDADKHIEISDRATLMNMLLITDAYTVGTGIMPSALNRGDIVSVPLQSKQRYIIGYLLKKDRKISEMTQKFIALIHNCVKSYMPRNEGENA